MIDTIAIVSRLSPQTIKTIDGATIDVFAALLHTLHCFVIHILLGQQLSFFNTKT